MTSRNQEPRKRQNFQAGRGNMIAAVKTKITDGVVGITGITKKLGPCWIQFYIFVIIKP